MYTHTLSTSVGPAQAVRLCDASLKPSTTPPQPLRYATPYSVQCFAVIDIVFNLLVGVSATLYGYISLGLILGPFCGYCGAKMLAKRMTLVYVAFCGLKTGFYFILGECPALPCSPLPLPPLSQRA